MLCFVTSVEEDECFQEKTNIAHQQLMKWKDKFFFPMSKEMSRILRHEKDSTLFDSRGTMEIFELFKRLEWKQVSPMGTNNITGKQFAAFLYANDKSRFQIDLYLNDEWKAYNNADHGPFQLRIGCIQGHSNEIGGPFASSTH